MALFSLHNLAIKGISAAVPRQREDNEDLTIISAKDREVYIQTTGIRYRHIAPTGTTASDLCIAATLPLMEKLDWAAADIDLLIFVTQTPDYLIPNTASVMHRRLALSKKCLVFDINLGCSGYVYGLSVIGALMQNMKGAKGLLMVGDCSSSVISKQDKSTYPLFGDAGSATALEYQEGQTWYFHLQSDGAGYEDIHISGGGMRNPYNEASLVEREYEAGIKRNDLQMKMDGINTFNFALREVAPNIEDLCTEFSIDKASINHFVLHQANKLMLECVRGKLKVSKEKFPYSLYNYGNTSSASIPLTIASEIATEVNGKETKLLLSGFGVGLSWGSAVLPLHEAIILPVVEL